MLKKGIPVLVIIMLLVLGGIIFIQYLWIRKSIYEKQALIDNQVVQAMTNVDDRLYDFRAMAFFTPSDTFHFTSRDSVIFVEESGDEFTSLPPYIAGDKQESHEVKVEILSTQDSNHNNLIISQTQLISHRIEADSLKHELVEIENEILRLEEVRNVFDQIRIEVDPHTGDIQLDSASIDHMLKKELAGFGLDTLIRWAVYDHADKHYVINENADTNYRSQVPLFKKDIINPGRYTLKLSLVNNTRIIWSDIRSMIISSVVLILILLGVFVVSLRLIIKHKKISRIKSDFMNNMTHEFKTPLASISLAADSILLPKVLEDPSKIKDYILLIQAEKNKLNQNVERILEVASLEKDNLELPHETFDLENLITETIQNMRLLFENRKADLTTDLQTNIRITGSRFHLGQAISNVLENSIKYSSGNPAIEVRLIQKGNKAELVIKDHGIGMSKDQVKRIFETFYRAQTGNIHNTKGFGLGLSYARFIIRKMNGEIAVESELKNGTSVTIQLPLA